jgi:hypothetical protein
VGCNVIATRPVKVDGPKAFFLQAFAPGIKHGHSIEPAEISLAVLNSLHFIGK